MSEIATLLLSRRWSRDWSFTKESLFALLEERGNNILHSNWKEKYSTDLPQGGLEFPCSLLFKGKAKRSGSLGSVSSIINARFFCFIIKHMITVSTITVKTGAMTSIITTGGFSLSCTLVVRTLVQCSSNASTSKAIHDKLWIVRDVGSHVNHPASTKLLQYWQA